jgi:hypothetical protein
MAISKYSAALLLAILPAALSTTALRAETVTVTISGVNGVVNSTNDFVLPYLLTLSGPALTSPVTIAADCYDFFDEVTVGQSWTANVLTLPGIATTGQYSSLPNALTLYEDVAWFSAQPATTPQEQIDLQQDMWNVFLPTLGPPPVGAFPVDAGMQTYLDELAATNLSTYDFTPFVFLEGVANDSVPPGSPLVQAFVIDTNVSGPLRITDTPEPGSLFLMFAGFVLAGGYWMSSRRKRSTSSNLA